MTAVAAQCVCLGHVSSFCTFCLLSCCVCKGPLVPYVLSNNNNTHIHNQIETTMITTTDHNDSNGHNDSNNRDYSDSIVSQQ